MLAKVIHSRRRHKPSAVSFKALIDYCCGKACIVVTGNLAGDWRDAALQMRVCAGRNARLRDPAYHLVLSWGDGEQPRDAEIIAAARLVIRELDGAAYQYVIAVHRDRRNVHCHIVLNRVHPLTGRALSLSHDYARLELGCRRVEHAFGWPPDRGRFKRAYIHGEIELAPQTAKHWDARRDARAAGLRPDPRAQRGRDLRGGRFPLRDRLTATGLSRLRRAIDTATSWSALHVRLHACGMRYLRHGPGARIEDQDSGGWMPAGQLGTGYALPTLLSRLGDYVPASDHLAESRQSRSDRRRAYHDARRARRNAIHDLQTKHSHERRRLATTVAGMHRIVAMSFRHALRQQQIEDLRHLRATQPVPVLSEFGLGGAREPSDPCRQSRLRYRHVLRRLALQDATSESEIDHTYLRQLWHGPTLDGVSNLRVPDKERLAAGLRDLGNKTILLPRRGGRSGALGYALITEQPDGALRVMDPQSDLALCTLGPRDARECIIVADTRLGIQCSLECPDCLVIVASSDPPCRQAEQACDLVGDRSVTIISGHDDDANDLFERLSPMLRDCRHRSHAYAYGDRSKRSAERRVTDETAMSFP
ncbi:relaxase/mobilization nuclease domain-containing protein [Qingshengfaniella alkalisoli]|uniref:relaxase/mobilization nuclease domain-containing protein n=1 Tax=Qingshengfaniella alkalisoli TaxID=2599296 RepID=UPI00143D34A6|nr:relaxase/mobilization nuclease domain-containing protein [Qingshengfaniella alkalisoli]